MRKRKEKSWPFQRYVCLVCEPSGLIRRDVRIIVCSDTYESAVRTHCAELGHFRRCPWIGLAMHMHHVCFGKATTRRTTSRRGFMFSRGAGFRYAADATSQSSGWSENSAPSVSCLPLRVCYDRKADSRVAAGVSFFGIYL